MKDTGQKIIDAASKVFARDGLSGATTREIARVAKVNEVTLFRHFKNKDELLRQVVIQSCKRFGPVFVDAPFETKEDLRRTLEVFASVYTAKVLDNEEFIRTLFSEIKRHQKLWRQMFVDSSTSVRQRFIEYLTSAQKKKLIRPDIDVTIAADTFTGMLFIGIMRRPLTEEVYPNERYVKTCVEIYLKGIEP